MMSKVVSVVGLIILIGLCIFLPPLAVVAFPFMILCLQKVGVIPK